LSRITVIDAQTAGISGDMLLGALIDAGADPKNVQRILDLIPQHYPKCRSIRLNTKNVKRHGFKACQAELETAEDESEANAEQFLKTAEMIGQAANLSDEASAFAQNSIKDIVYAESGLHGSSPQETHLHEAGSADTLGDVFGAAVACDALGIFNGEIYSTPVSVGGGTVTFSHGELAVPAPAVLEIARQKRVPIRGGPENLELTTPTGISILANLARTFLENYPPITAVTVGYGAGKMELQTSPNVLRLVMGVRLETGTGGDTVSVLETNLDDLPGEMLGHTLTRVIESGAKDAWITHAQFKKNRPGQVLHVICDPEISDRLARLIVAETGTLGVRYHLWNRFTLQRETRTVILKVKGKQVSLRVKLARDREGKIVSLKPEFDDVQRISRDLSITAREVSEMTLRKAREALEENGS